MKYRRVEPVSVGGEPAWSYNVGVCDDEEQFVARLPLMAGIETDSVWYGERELPLRRAASEVG